MRIRFFKMYSTNQTRVRMIMNMEAMCTFVSRLRAFWRFIMVMMKSTKRR